MSIFNYAGDVPVKIQDQATRPLFVKFNEVQNSTTLLSGATKGTYTIQVTDTTGFVDGRYIILFHPPSKNFSFYTQIGAPSGNTITLDTPIDYSYPAGTYADAAITNMNVNGSGTPRVFGLRGTGIPPGVSIVVHITRVMFSCICSSAVDLSTFGNLPALTRGLLFRRRNDLYTNHYNVKTNGDLAGLMFDFDEYAATNPVQGVDGFAGRLTYGGQHKLGVVIDLPLGEDAEFLVQDDLSGLTKLEILAEGHVVEPGAGLYS